MRQGPAGSIMIYFKLSKYIEGDVYGGLLKCRIPKTVGSILELQEDVWRWMIWGIPTLENLHVATGENLHVATGQNHCSLFFTQELMAIILLDSRGSNPV